MKITQIIGCMLALVACFMACFMPSALAQQVTIIVNAIPANTPANDDIYIAGTFNNWNPSSAAHILQHNTTNNTYQITLPCNGTISYKFTRGTGWATVEGNAQGNAIANRTFTCTSGNTITHQILSWEDLSGGTGGSGHTATSNTTIINNNFAVPQLGTTRRVWVYLPTDYAQNPTKKYPVMYLQDGQNLFDDFYSFSGEWGVDETLNQLFNTGDNGCIVVGIDNGGASRIDEYSPWVNPTYGGGQGAQYMNFIVNTLKPYIDANYHTDPSRNTTGIGGSSLGALISLYGALEYQNVFSKALIFSPAFWFSNQCFAHATAQGKQQDMRIYMLCGQNEGSNMATYQTQMRTTLLNAGFGANEVVNIPKADGQHSEWFWKREFGAGYQWLFSNTVGNEAAIQPEEINVFADPFTDSATILLPTNTHKARLILTDMQGRVWIKRNIRSEELLQLSHLPAGIYNISIATKTQTLTQKVVKK